MNQDYADWLKELKAGDDVAYSSGTPGLWTVTPITRITGDQIHTQHWTFYTDTGKCTNCCRPGRPRLLIPPTDDIRRDYKRRMLIDQLQRTKFNTLTDEALQQIVSVVNTPGNQA